MLVEKDIVRIKISRDIFKLAERNAGVASKGGRSNVRESGERGKMLSLDNLIGQLGMIAMSKFLYGHIGDYLVNQFYANLYRNAGDGGYDFTAMNLDVKAARFYPGRQRQILDYRLAVHRNEWHDDWVYALAVVDLDNRVVFLTGWAAGDDFPEEAISSDAKRFRDSYVIAARDLNRFPPFKWNWFPINERGINGQ